MLVNFRRFVGGLFAAAIALGAASSSAVGTRTFELTEGDDFEGGELEGVAVDSAGRVRAGFNLGNVPITEAISIWSALPMPDGSVLLGTGNEGKLYRVRGATAELAAETHQLVATSLARAWGGTVVVGTMPEGKVLKYERGQVTDLATLEGVEHVWQVAYDEKTRSIFAATGPDGKLFRIDAQGNAQVYFDAEEQHLMSVAVAADGTVYTGASDEAKLYEVTGPGRASVLYDFGRTEVRAVATVDDGTVYAIANEIKPGSHTPKKQSTRSGVVAGPVTNRPETKGKGTLYRFSPDGAPEQLIDNDDEHFVSLVVGADRRPYVGTGVEGRVYTVDETHSVALVADTDSRQIGALSVGGKNGFVAASDPAVFHPIRGVGGTDAVWTSKAFDAGLRARFGRLSWLSTGAIELSTRTGNTGKPDDTWSAWSAPLVQPGSIQSPAGRYIQVRARFNRDPKAVLREVSIPFVTDNLRAVVTEITARDGDGGTKTGVHSSGGPIEDEPSPKLSLKWKVDNPDKDELRYRLQYRLIGTDAWYDVLDPKETLTKDNYSWDTSDLPEGRYRLRVTASDELSNPPGLAKKHELESSIVLVDNTPPTIENLRIAGGRVSGVALDGVGPIARIEIGVAGSEQWFPFFPQDGIFDEAREPFDADISALSPPSKAIVSVRVYDQANNFVVRHVTLP